MSNPKNEKGKMWAYFAPDGNIQVRSIGETKKESREMISYGHTLPISYRQYESQGFILKRIEWTINVL